MGVLLSEQEIEEQTEQTEATDEQQVSESEYRPNKSVAEMNDAERAEYYTHRSRRYESSLRKFGGVTPEAVQQMQSRIAELEAEKETADERAIREAKEAAAKEAREVVMAELAPKLHRSQLKSVASQVLSGEQLDAWLDGVDPSKFVGESGEIDEATVMGKLTALFGAPKARPNWGQHGTTPPGETPGSAGKAEAERRLQQNQSS